MASGYWTGNSRDMPPSNHLVRAGWAAENVDCRARLTLALKAHQFHGRNKRCGYEKSIIILRNPFDAIVSDFKLSSGSKTSEPDPSVFEGAHFQTYARRRIEEWFALHQAWLEKAQNITLHWTCFQQLVQNTETVIGEWLDFLEMDHRRLHCIYEDFTGEFYREKTISYPDPFHQGFV